jgi:organic hydroperoxide reductase OsmC/OhrA
MHKSERFSVTTTWTGNQGSGTSTYRAYGRDHHIHAGGKEAAIPGSSAAGFRGDAGRYNPEELLIGALSACHMLWFLHLCSERGIAVTGYIDEAEGTLDMDADGAGEFREVVLHPSVDLSDESRRAELEALHERSHEMCFIARSVNFPVRCRPAVRQ